VDVSKVPDGIYVGSYSITPPAGAMAGNKSVEVRVTVAGGKYTNFEVLKPKQLAKSQPFPVLFSRVKETQHLSVDAITGATITSMAILKAIQAAVSSAGGGTSQ
jgi:uncharacterized protein with FMN-binding domain